MNPKCPRLSASQVEFSKSAGPCLGPSVRDGVFWRASDSRIIPRFKCQSCRRSFSSATTSACYGQKKRRLNLDIEQFYCSGVSQRRLALLLTTNRKTVARKIRFLAAQAKSSQSDFLATTYSAPAHRLKAVQFDDLETSEHSKCKPLSVALAIDPMTRRILSFQVSQMPAKGLLKKIALKKYGKRKDERSKGWSRLMRELSSVVAQDACFKSDENPHYPRHLKREFPTALHTRLKSRRGCGAGGQGELKKIGFDPLFSLNHTCAMLRANMNRLFRRTWCTTKKKEGLENHLAIYVNFHNQVLTGRPSQKLASASAG
jgi:transposase-like protein